MFLPVNLHTKNHTQKCVFSNFPLKRGEKSLFTQFLVLFTQSKGLFTHCAFFKKKVGFSFTPSNNKKSYDEVY